MARKNIQMRSKAPAPVLARDFWRQFAWANLRHYAKGRGVDVGRRSRVDIERDLDLLDGKGGEV